MKWLVMAGLVLLMAGCEVVDQEGADCSGSVICGDGLSCVNYFDVAGQERNECFETCRTDNNCSAGRQCAEVVNDGPDGVCFDAGGPE